MSSECSFDLGLEARPGAGQGRGLRAVVGPLASGLEKVRPPAKGRAGIGSLRPIDRAEAEAGPRAGSGRRGGSRLSGRGLQPFFVEWPQPLGRWRVQLQARR